jgi:putative hydrolase of the HAD superfamily
MQIKTIILNLDDTIFETKSMDKNFFNPFFDVLMFNLKPIFNLNQIEQIYNDLCKYSWNFVIEKHKIPKEIFINSIKILENSNFELKIKTFPDYTFMKKLPVDKFLVTTGLTFLQNLKIKALNIENDFKEIVINDRLISNETKFDIFKKLILKHNFNLKESFIIGDNPDSEIKAGNELSFKTIQILRKNVEKGNNADLYIYTFEELIKILN